MKLIALDMIYHTATQFNTPDLKPFLYNIKSVELDKLHDMNIVSIICNSVFNHPSLYPTYEHETTYNLWIGGFANEISTLSPLNRYYHINSCHLDDTIKISDAYTKYVFVKHGEFSICEPTMVDLYCFNELIHDYKRNNIYMLKDKIIKELDAQPDKLTNNQLW